MNSSTIEHGETNELFVKWCQLYNVKEEVNVDKDGVSVLRNT